jgi:hypothetical protein
MCPRTTTSLRGLLPTHARTHPPTHPTTDPPTNIHAPDSELAALRTGRADPRILDKVRVEAYAATVSLEKVAQVGCFFFIYVSAYYCMCRHTTVDVSSCYCMCLYATICVLIKKSVYVPSYDCLCVLILLYMCPHTTVCVLILLYLCPHSAVCVRMLLYTTVFVSS